MERNRQDMQMETERLLLRPWKKNKADAKELYLYAKNPHVGPAAGWPVHRDPAHSLEIIRSILSTEGIFAIVWKETGRPVGCAGLTYGSTSRKWMQPDEAELGYWLGEPWWGRGIAKEASLQLLQYAFEELHMQRVWAAYYEGNERSARLQERLGFVFHHRAEPEMVEALGEVRTETFNVLTRSAWEQRIAQTGAAAAKS